MESITYYMHAHTIDAFTLLIHNMYYRQSSLMILSLMCMIVESIDQRKIMQMYVHEGESRIWC